MLALAFLGAAFVSTCSGDSDGGAVPPDDTPVTSTDLEPDERAPGVVVQVLALSGSSGPSSSFRPGDRITVEYTLAKDDGSPWNVSEMPIARALVSGPTSSYQRVIAEQDDVRARSTPLGGGRYRYTIAVPIPNAYLAPLNDTTAFGTADGERTGQPLLDGTYTVGLTFGWDYTVEGEAFRDAGETAADFLLGDSAVMSPRAVTSQANCNRCHFELRAHDDLHRDVRVCVLCHTAGAEDLNDPAVEGGTPRVSVEMRVLFHKIHNGKHLPSVVGVAVGDDDGNLTYAATPVPYRVVGGDGAVYDYSAVDFPAFPGRSIPMPKDFGHPTLPADAQARDLLVRTGITDCRICHGDPDGAGPLEAPAQGDIIQAQPSRNACGACHDDVDWTRNYKVNQQVMPPQPSNSGCNLCHLDLGGALDVIDGHRHPLLDTIFEPHAPFFFAFNTGLDLEILSAGEGAGSDQDGTLDPGETVRVVFDLRDDAGETVMGSTLDGLRAVISGPTDNTNLVHDVEFPPARLAGDPPYDTNLPERRQLELVGRSTVLLGDVFTTQGTPHWHVAGATTRVSVRAGSGPSTTLAAAAPALQNFVDVAGGGAFARDDVVVLDDGVLGAEEYVRVQFVDGNRLWFSSPATPAYPAGLRFAHAAGAGVALVALTPLAEGADWSLEPSSGTITELAEFGDGRAVLADYVTDFVLPRRFPVAAHGSPDLDDTWGDWSGKLLVSGTYRVALTGWIDKVLDGAGVQDLYRIISPAATRDVLVGSAVREEPYQLVSSGANCNACHQEFYFHEGTARGFDECIVCHAAAGSEDVPRYVAANAPATPGVTVNFRTLVHQLHMGKRLDAADRLAVNAAGPAPYPDNFTTKSYATYSFPAQPGGVARCTACHGATNEAWKEPAPRAHPSEQGAPVRTWRSVCATCHDSAAAGAHIELETTPGGVEACAVCHGPGAQLAVDFVHQVR